MEGWIDIEGYEGRYRVSSLGRVYSCMYKRVLAQMDHYRGYKIIFLYDAGHVMKKHFVHRLVARAFLPNPDTLPVVNHINGDKVNNCQENLEWVSFSGNTQHWHDKRERAEVMNDAF